MAGKKNFTKADEAIDKFFAPQQSEETIQDTNINKDTHINNNTNVDKDTHVANNANTNKDTHATNNTNINKDTHITNDTNINKDTHITQSTNNANISKVTNKSKHYNERGKRAERFGLLLDEQLKEDLKHLSMAKGSKSINDFIVTILLEYVEREENQTKLEQYRKLLQD